MGLLKDILGLNKDNEEKETNIYNLSKEEKEEVKKGNYEAWNFEEEEKEDDDYYYEDDD